LTKKVERRRLNRLRRWVEKVERRRLNRLRRWVEKVEGRRLKRGVEAEQRPHTGQKNNMRPL